MSLFPVFIVQLPFSRCRESTSYVLSYRVSPKENLNASKPSDQLKGLGGNIDYRDKNLYMVLKGFPNVVTVKYRGEAHRYTVIVVV